MSQFTYVRPEKIYPWKNPELNELWIQNRIGEDPTILSLGDLIFKDREQPQPGTGRLDLLLQDPDSYHYHNLGRKR